MPEWREEQNRFSSFDNLRLHCRRLIPAGETCHTVMLVHGLGEHAGRYGNLYNHLLPLGYEIYAPDLRGHGLSEGKRGHVNRFTEFIDDLEALRKKIDDERPRECNLEAGNIMIGHSMGGLIALKYALEHQDKLRAVIVSGPALHIAADVPAWKTSLGKILSGIVPKFSMPNEVDPGLLSHDPQVAPQYEKDPLVHNMVSTRWYTEFVGTMDEVHSRAGEMEIPILIMHGGDDRLTGTEGSKRFYDNCGSPDKTLKIYEGMYHEIYNETDHRQVMADLEKWLKERSL